MKTCPKCQTPHDKIGTFCSRACSNSRGPTKNETKKGPCSKCGKEIEIGKRGSFTQAHCEDCEAKKERVKLNCSICGSLECLKPKICATLKNRSLRTYISFGFDVSNIGSLKVYEEYDRINACLEDEYLNGGSLLELADKYQISDELIRVTLKRLGIARRTNSDAVSNAILKGLLNGPRLNFKSGWHKTWRGTEVFLRSSYEFYYAKQLDQKQIEYICEALRIGYWDSQVLCNRNAIPDFYLPTTNTIVEIKALGSPWYDPINMEDKKKAYLAHGYKFELKLW
jgi:hypothetical protein